MPDALLSRVHTSDYSRRLVAGKDESPKTATIVASVDGTVSAPFLPPLLIAAPRGSAPGDLPSPLLPRYATGPYIIFF